MSDIERHAYQAIPGTGPRADRCADCYQSRDHSIHVAAPPAEHAAAMAGVCSHGGHGWEGDTCSDIPVTVTVGKTTGAPEAVTIAHPVRRDTSDAAMSASYARTSCRCSGCRYCDPCCCIPK